MSRTVIAVFFLAATLVCSLLTELGAAQTEARQLDLLVVDYPLNQSIFPPEFPPPTFLWRDPGESSAWVIEVRFESGLPGLRIESDGPPMELGEIDPEAVSESNELPKLTPEQKEAHTWKPSASNWSRVKEGSVETPALVTITGFRDKGLSEPLSYGEVTIRTAREPVGAPIFYRDVPLMPSANESGVIQPLAPSSLPLIQWRLLEIGNSESRVVMSDQPTCANCHSFSLDGSTMGMDMDGPQNDKGLYALVPVHESTVIDTDDVIEWSAYEGKLGGMFRTTFMTQVSPDGEYVVGTINDPGAASRQRMGDVIGKYYVSNFKDYRFLQVFYPTRGILAWYSRDTETLQPLPGADDPRYVHTGATWSPDGKYLIFSRAEAKDPYPPGALQARYPNDPNELQIQYDLYRIPFNNGRGGRAEPVIGASNNGKSNNFAKVSPDGRWIVYVQCQNGQLLRPDSELYIVPFEGGEPRRMTCNNPLMNSWHSFSPNGRWMVFSSKGRSPYTQMFLTHIDEKGQDSPAILIEGAKAANRAVNIPEFVNLPPDGLREIRTPATDFYKRFDLAAALMKEGRYLQAIREWRKAARLDPEDPGVYAHLGAALAAVGKPEEAVKEFHQALELDPGHPEANTSLGLILAQTGRVSEAVSLFERALESDPRNIQAHINMAGALIELGRPQDAVSHCNAVLSIDPDHPTAHANLAIAYAISSRFAKALPHFRRALEGSPESAAIHRNFGFALLASDQPGEAVSHLERALQLSGVEDPVTLSYLSEAYFRLDQPSKALAIAERALELAGERGLQELARSLSQKIEAYEGSLTAQ